MSIEDWTSKDKNRFAKWLKSHLAYGEVTITFEKKDGTLREMRCTLKDVPEYERKTDVERKPSPDVISVYDLDKSDWRSFRIDSVKNVSFNLS